MNVTFKSLLWWSLRHGSMFWPMPESLTSCVTSIFHDSYNPIKIIHISGSFSYFFPLNHSKHNSIFCSNIVSSEKPFITSPSKKNALLLQPLAILSYCFIFLNCYRLKFYYLWSYILCLPHENRHHDCYISWALGTILTFSQHSTILILKYLLIS